MLMLPGHLGNGEREDCRQRHILFFTEKFMYDIFHHRLVNSVVSHVSDELIIL